MPSRLDIGNQIPFHLTYLKVGTTVLIKLYLPSKEYGIKRKHDEYMDHFKNTRQAMFSKLKHKEGQFIRLESLSLKTWKIQACNFYNVTG